MKNLIYLLFCFVLLNSCVTPTQIVKDKPQIDTVKGICVNFKQNELLNVFRTEIINTFYNGDSTKFDTTLFHPF